MVKTNVFEVINGNDFTKYSTIYYLFYFDNRRKVSENSKISVVPFVDKSFEM